MNVFQSSKAALLVTVLLGLAMVASAGQKGGFGEGLLIGGGGIGGGEEYLEQEEVKRPAKNDVFANALGGLGGAFGGLLGGKKEAPVVVVTNGGLPSGGGVAAGGVVAAGGAEGGKKEGEGELLSLEKLGEWAKLIFSPFELVKAIGEHFKVPFEKLVETIGGGVVFGAEAFMQPVVISMQIFEDVFVPDQCILKTVCKVGEHLAVFREGVVRFTPHFLEESDHIHALSEGILGHDCEIKYNKCGGGEPQLRKPIEELRLKDLEELTGGSKDFRASGSVGGGSAGGAGGLLGIFGGGAKGPKKL